MKRRLRRHVRESLLLKWGAVTFKRSPVLFRQKEPNLNLGNWREVFEAALKAMGAQRELTVKVFFGSTSLPKKVYSLRKLLSLPLRKKVYFASSFL